VIAEQLALEIIHKRRAERAAALSAESAAPEQAPLRVA
jgi:hypothetical protein